MSFQFTWETRPAAPGLDDKVAVLRNANNCLEVWPALGFNAYRWTVGGHELLYRTPTFFAEQRPTRSGVPILFPFPNRIRDGRFTFPPLPPGEGQGVRETYTLPLTDSTKKNAIHGFTTKHPWRVIDQSADADSAWITGEFQGSVDAPDSLLLWPADYRLRVTYRLLERTLRVEAAADNPGPKPLPFGLGYHPYFSLAPFGGPQAIVTVEANKYWELIDNLPTGRTLPVDEPRDLRHGRSYSALQLDDVLTDLRPIAVDQQDGLGLAGVVAHPSGERMLTLWAGADFRELVLFTPPHREAICLEPYTCTTDAINLSASGIDAGLRVLQPGETWRGVIEIHLAN